MPKYRRRPGNFFFLRRRSLNKVSLSWCLGLFLTDRTKKPTRFLLNAEYCCSQKGQTCKKLHWRRLCRLGGITPACVVIPSLNFCLLWLCLCHISFKLNVPLLCHTEVGLFLCFVGVGIHLIRTVRWSLQTAKVLEYIESATEVQRMYCTVLYCTFDKSSSCYSV